MTIFILVLILVTDLQASASNLDTVFQVFLTTPLSPKSYQDKSVEVKNLYKLYKNQFNRPLMTLTEERTRFAAFNDTVFTLFEDYQQGGKTYTVALNKFADWTSDELKDLRGLRRPQDEIIVLLMLNPINVS